MGCVFTPAMPKDGCRIRLLIWRRLPRLSIAGHRNACAMNLFPKLWHKIQTRTREYFRRLFG